MDDMFFDEDILEEEFPTPKEDSRREFKKDISHKEKILHRMKENKKSPGYEILDTVFNTRTGKVIRVIKKPYLKRISKSSHDKRYKKSKRHGNKVIRKTTEEISNGSMYKRMFKRFLEVD